MARMPKPTRGNGKKSVNSADPVVLPNKLVAGVSTATPASGRSANLPLLNPNQSFFNQSISQLRGETDTGKALRTLARIHGDVSASVASMVRLASTPLHYSVYDSSHQVSEAGQLLLRSILARFNNLSNYTQGFDDRPNVACTVDTLIRETILTGATALELVLDENRLPIRLNPVSPASLSWKTAQKAVVGKVKAAAGQSDKTSPKIIPFQRVSGSEVELDIPTFFYAALDQDPLNAFPQSPIESALNASIFHSDTVEDIRQVTRRSGHSRLSLAIDLEKLMQAAPPTIKSDPTKLTAWMEQVRDSVKTELESLSPDEALVFFDTIKADYLNSEIGATADYTPLMEVIDGIQSTALRTPPSVLGKRMGGSQNISSTESLLFIKTAEGVRGPAASVLERAFTLAIRLYGFEGYVDVKFEPIDLRPKQELEAFRIMEQQRVLELLSYGFLTDAEAAEILGTGALAPTAQPMSGTRFYSQGSVAPPSPNDNPATRALTTDQPKAAGGKDNAKR